MTDVRITNQNLRSELRAWQFALVAMLCLLLGASVPATDVREYTDDEITAKFAALEPKDSDFVFTRPPGWSANLALHAPITPVVPTAEDPSAARIVDGLPATTWTCRAEGSRATVLLDLGKDVRFDRLVVFNRQTDNRGSGGGNNAVKRLVVAVATSATPSKFETIGDYAVDGPRPVCFKRKGGGQVCSFIDNAAPNVMTLSPVLGRYVKVSLIEAFWGTNAKDSWKTSVAMSEFMLFDSKGGS